MMWTFVVTRLGRWWITWSGPLGFQRDLVFSTSITQTLNFHVWPRALLPSTPPSSAAMDSLILPQDPMSVWTQSLKVNKYTFAQFIPYLSWLTNVRKYYMLEFFNLNFFYCLETILLRSATSWREYKISCSKCLKWCSLELLFCWLSNIQQTVT